MSERNSVRDRVSGDSEELSGSSVDGADFNKGSESETDPNVSNEGHKLYDYDGHVDDNDAEDSRSDCSPPRDDGDSDSIVIEYEREEGDGQESVPPKEKKLDDDEDRRNPQYIPKRGTFYEHDDRTVIEDVDEETTEKDSERGKENQGNDKKKVWKENENRWSHDRYNEDEQTPKSRDELVAIYGYDIRNEEAPPRARRRRRYGRGPNKYTRNWEDEDAYTKAANALGLRGGRRGGGTVRGGRHSGEEFPPLQQHPSSQSEGEDKSGELHVKNDATPTTGRIEERQQPASEKDRESKPTVSSNAWKKDTNQNNVDMKKEEAPQRSLPPAWKNANQSVPAHRNMGAVIEEKTEEMSGKWKGSISNRGRGRGVSDDAESGRRSRGRATSRGGGRGGRVGSTASQSASGTGRSLSETRVSSHDEGSSGESGGAGYQIQSQIITRTQDDVAKEMSQMTINEQRVNKDKRPNKNQSNFHQNSERRQVVPPRMQQENAANRPKRYSSQRQRSLPESNGPSYTQQPHSYYQPGYVQQPVYTEAPPAPPPAPQQQPPQPPPPMMPPGYPPPYPAPAAYMQPVPAAPPPRILQPPPGPPPGPYVQPPPPPAPIINYIAAPAQGQYPPQGFPAFQGFAPVAPGQPPELFQAQGITYYSPEEQVMSRPPPVAQKRQRAAIPIVPPPEGLPKGRGRLREGEMTEPGNTGSHVVQQQQQPQPGQYDDAPHESEAIVQTSVPLEQEVRSYPYASWFTSNAASIHHQSEVAGNGPLVEFPAVQNGHWLQSCSGPVAEFEHSMLHSYVPYQV